MMDVPRLQIELYGRLFVEMIKAGIIPVDMVQRMRADFQRSSDIAERDVDQQHFNDLAMLAETLLMRSDFDVIGDIAHETRGRFRVIQGIDGGNEDT
ncbi:hypothetical protein GG804_27185 [Sphingomonas histidinilytica]|uniref:hypothetical protein n=1 Tax=Rhizorhabdus histidinilytica TaxID=439228 RepID=UPI001ADB6A53|nr:hypothetical protein [Rhizorhabdus histidinilytica]MBO9380452.1 hypothetical protein [Rhizorhabdus histidinilytica]